MLPVDIFFSADDGWAETRHVFLQGNGLPGSWAGSSRFVVSELGFGTGLNLVALAALVDEEREAGRTVPQLVFQSVEWEPRPEGDLRALSQRWPRLRGPVEALLAIYSPRPGWNRWTWPWGEVVLWVGDARRLSEATARKEFEPADCWFLDGFAPDRNPELWGADLLDWVARSTKPGGTASTYSAAGVVKQGLRAAGFTVVRAPGWGKKRHMVKARLASPAHFSYAI